MARRTITKSVGWWTTDGNHRRPVYTKYHIRIRIPIRIRIRTLCNSQFCFDHVEDAKMRMKPKKGRKLVMWGKENIIIAGGDTSRLFSFQMCRCRQVFLWHFWRSDAFRRRMLANKKETGGKKNPMNAHPVLANFYYSVIIRKVYMASKIRFYLTKW